MGALRELSARIALKQRRYSKPMNTTIDTLANPGDLLHAMLEGLLVVEISHATAVKEQPQPHSESRRGPGIQSLRSSRVSVSGRCRPAR